VATRLRRRRRNAGIGSRARSSTTGTSRSAARAPDRGQGPYRHGAAQTRKLIVAGAIPIRCTSTPRGPGHQTWGHTDRGPTRNPWRPDLSPAGPPQAPPPWSRPASSRRPPAATAPAPSGSRQPGAASTATSRPPSSASWEVSPPLPHRRSPARSSATPASSPPGPLQSSAPPPPHRAAAPQAFAWSADLGFAGAHLDEEVVRIARRAGRRLAAARGPAGPRPR
jgi:hypothetical protein